MKFAHFHSIGVTSELFVCVESIADLFLMMDLVFDGGDVRALVFMFRGMG